MLVTDKKTGYSTSSGRIKYVTPWSKEMAGKGSMRFYGDEIHRLVDVIKDKDGTYRVFTYPHNTNDIITQVNKRDKEIGALYDDLKAVSPNDDIFTIVIPDADDVAIMPIKEDDFTDYYPSASLEDEMFIFKSELSSSYTYWVFDQHNRKTYPEVLHTLASMSHDMMDCADKPTQTGMEFAYILLNSRRNREFSPVTPYLSSMNFPTSGRAEVSQWLKTDALMKFVEECGAHNLTTSTESVKDDASELVGALVDEDDEMYGKPSMETLLLRIQKQVLDKMSINLSDIFQVGLSKVIASLPLSTVIIDVHLDVPEVGRKMCIHEGIFHLIPLSKDTKGIFEFFGEPEEMFMVHESEDTFPRKSAGLLPPYSADLPL